MADRNTDDLNEQAEKTEGECGNALPVLRFKICV
jgi:hypothetical protein